MSACESVTGWLEELKDGESVAAQRLWERYIKKLVQLAKNRLDKSPRRVADEEDVAAIAFASFCRGVENQRFPKLDDRDDLWQILVVLTERTAIDQLRYERAAKRGGGKVRGESAFNAQLVTGSAALGFDQIVDSEPTTDFAIQVADQLEFLLNALADELLQHIAIEKLEGYTNEEISDRLGMSLRSVERQLRLIRRIWDREQRDDRPKVE